MSKPVKLYYFPIRGRGEPIRLFLEATKTPWENVVLDRTTFPKYKTNPDFCYFGQLPVIQHGDFILAQTNAILRYIARITKKYGSNDEEASRIDMIMDGAEDLRVAYLRVIYQSKDDEEFAKNRDALVQTFENRLQPFERFLQKNGDGKGWFVGKDLSPADASFYDVLDTFCVLSEKTGQLLDTKFPLLKAWKKRFEDLPEIAKYMKSDSRFKQINANGRQ